MIPYESYITGTIIQQAQLEEMVKKNEDVELLMSVPGIGINTATKIAAYG